MTNRIIRDDRPEPSRVKWVHIDRVQVDAFIWDYLMHGADVRIRCDVDGISHVVVRPKPKEPDR